MEISTPCGVWWVPKKILCHIPNWYMLFILVGALYTSKTVDASFTVKNHQYPLKFTLPYLTKQVGDNVL